MGEAGGNEDGLVKDDSTPACLPLPPSLLPHLTHPLPSPTPPLPASPSFPISPPSLSSPYSLLPQLPLFLSLFLPTGPFL